MHLLINQSLSLLGDRNVHKQKLCSGNVCSTSKFFMDALVTFCVGEAPTY